MTLRVSAPGKCVLLGEYAVLEGAPALVAAVNQRAVVWATPAACCSLHIPSWSLGPVDFTWVAGKVQFAAAALQGAPQLAYFCAVSAAVWQLAQQLGIRLEPCALRLDTTAFFAPKVGIKLGLGSSAALSLALLVAYLGVGGEATTAWVPSPQLLAWAHQVHQAGQNALVDAAAPRVLGSGIDTAASLYGGILRFTYQVAEQKHHVQPLGVMADMTLLPVWSGTAASTPALLRCVATLKQQQPQRYWEIFEKLATYAQAGVEFWALGESAAFCSIVEAFYQTLCQLGAASQVALVTPAHAAIHREVRRLHSFYKPSGAGGGDIGVAFCPRAALARRCRQRLQQHYQVLDWQPEPHGLQLSNGA